jgi:hypothetical protein
MDLATHIASSYSHSAEWTVHEVAQSCSKTTGGDLQQKTPNVRQWTSAATYNDACSAICLGSSEVDNFSEVITMLRQNPRLAAEKNKWGCTLLHWCAPSLQHRMSPCVTPLVPYGRAAYYNVMPNVVCALLGASPKAASEPTTTDKCLPLHIAAAWNLEPAAVAAIYLAFPDAIMHHDINGYTPAEKAQAMGHEVRASS